MLRHASLVGRKNAQLLCPSSVLMVDSSAASSVVMADVRGMIEIRIDEKMKRRETKEETKFAMPEGVEGKDREDKSDKEFSWLAAISKTLCATTAE
ncbi:unnamed protein product [Peronospora destructor]|uniref:Uncharacterized protein n=1 Tax=Peronospora destructor TaxID=86335 RepID=A0AAV0U6U7_9STRA|nr:unnamed protein product [Peronospora destructor]